MIEDDRTLARVLAKLRRSVEADPVAVAAVKRTVRQFGGGGRLARMRLWLTRPRIVRVAPVQAIAGVAIIGLAAFLVWPDQEISSGPDRLGSAAAAGSIVHPIRFTYIDEQAQSVVVVGDFNGWDLEMTPLRRVAPGGIWVAEMPLRKGRYTYSFVVDGSIWRPDPAAVPAPADDFGLPSSVLLVSDTGS
jgi:hypothetical protein